MQQKIKIGLTVLATLVSIIVLLEGQPVEADQGCPFDDSGCQEYCALQGCNMGYCGHFAWIQCICRKCGDEWNWYDKVRYRPDKKVNQTELDSLKLNSSIILTNSTTGKQEQTSGKEPATVTTLLIPDLSDNTKLDLNDVPDENSDKFLDYLAKNHERLVQATNSDRAKGGQQQQQQPTDEISSEQSEGDLGAPEAGTTSAPTEETVEIQISSNNNTNITTSSNSNDDHEDDDSQSANRPLTRLLKMAVEERGSDEIN